MNSQIAWLPFECAQIYTVRLKCIFCCTVHIASRPTPGQRAILMNSPSLVKATLSSNVLTRISMAAWPDRAAMSILPSYSNSAAGKMDMAIFSRYSNSHSKFKKKIRKYIRREHKFSGFKFPKSIDPFTRLHFISPLGRMV